MHIAEKLRRRIRDEDGGIMVFIIMMFLTMIVAAGMAVDFMRHETARADLQNALDRGLLAVTASSQTAVDYSSEESLEAMVSSYMAARSFKAEVMTLDVPVPVLSGATSRDFTATASYEMPTYFLKLIGIPQMKVAASSGASEGFNDTELALVLDVSSSMVWVSPGTRLQSLKDGASLFVEKLLDDEQKVDKTMISIVPYSANTGLPPTMAEMYNVTSEDWYNYDNLATNESNQSVCVEFDFGGKDKETDDIGDFADLDIVPNVFGIDADTGTPLVTTAGTALKRMKHFRLATQSTYNPNQQAGCVGAENTIFPFSNNEGLLKDYIANLTAEHATATYQGIKWGVALLQPSSQPVLTHMYDNGWAGIIDTDQADGYWPRNPSVFVGTKKVLVIISDGANTESYTIDDETYRAGDPETEDDDDDLQALYDYWETRDGFDENAITNRIYRDDDTDNDGTLDGNELMSAICAEARASGIEIYTIAYEITEDSTEDLVLEDCASTELPGEHHFPNVGEGDLDDVFDKIAAGVTKLRLTN